METQGDLLLNARFDGDTYDATRDQKRLSGLLLRVFELMKDGQWRTLRDIADVCRGSEAGVSARLRDFRKPRFGGYKVERQRHSRGLWTYRLTL